MAKQSKSTLLVNTFAVFGYLSLCFQWLWVGVAILPSLLKDPAIRDFFIPQQNPIVAPQTPVDTPLSPLMLIIAIAITLVVIVVSVVILVRLPIAIAKTGKKTVSSTSEAIIPIITHRHKLPPKKQKILTFELIKLIKFTLSVLPVVFLLISTQVTNEGQLSDEIIVFIGTILATGSLVWFSLEYVFARALKVPRENLL